MGIGLLSLWEFSLSSHSEDLGSDASCTIEVKRLYEIDDMILNDFWSFFSSPRIPDILLL